MAKITIYTTPTCIYCKMAKEFLSKNNVAYEEKDVASDLQAREEMVAKSHQLGVPVIDIDGEIVVGFNEEAIKEILKIE